MTNRRWKFKKSFLFIIAVVGMLALIAFAERKGSDKKYEALEVYVQGISDVYFVDEKEIRQLLENEFPTLRPGLSLEEVSIKQIEDKVESHPFVKNAEVFKDLKGKVVVKIDQYRPIARIIRPSAAHGYISSEGVILPTSPNYTTRVLTIEGPMAESLLSKDDLSEEHSDLLDLIHFIENDDFWHAQIAGMEIGRKKDIKLFQQVGKQVIEFGKPTDIEEKFEKISLFYKEILPSKGWDAYKTVNVKYKDQIICE
jgi:cell division protein FtsQ